ncbi:AfsR/SARP family transcriptional regulator [Streptomyces sp. DH12]|uniref:AfsR/SARP family transcriptional regulator n=1 Tax=Streptomyces sp. DH12 TaxID=2857010 RepID=UPI001E5AE9BF|nr:AfsR/SARP family transcriptional regulator [Streptomyces sp. DH12]
MALLSDGGLEFRLLGPLEVRVAGRRLPLTAPRLRHALAALLLHADRTVSVDQLAEGVWEDRLPADPANQVAVCVSLLRRRFARAGAPDGLILTTPPGYLLTTRRAVLDTALVRRLAAESEARAGAGEREEAAALLRRALSLWRGPLLEGTARRAWQPEVRAWEEERLALHARWAELESALGRYEGLVAELSALVQERPFLERPRAQLMTALYRSGRRADALRLYREGARLLDEELGVTPGPELRRLHEEILRDSLPPRPEPPAPPRPPASAVPATPAAPAVPATPAVPAAPAAPAASEDPDSAAVPAAAATPPPPPSPSPAPSPPPAPDSAPPPPPPVGPCLLPGGVAEFVGREREVAVLTEVLAPGGRPADRDGTALPAAGRVPVAEVVGAGGTGKTALALHVAHGCRPAFPDGQLYINLRGLHTDPVPPEEALARFLRELGTPGPAIPDGLEERAEKYRALLADRRVLIILDDAASAAQIRPLMPGTGSCAVVVTSRSRVATSFAARVVEPGLFSRAEARELLARIAGADRPAAEPDAARRLLEHCGRLPLAVSIVGAKLAAKPHWTLDRAAGRLADERRRLDELEHDSLAVRTSLALSYRGIGPVARLLLRRLAVLAPPDFADWIAPPLLDAAPDEAEAAVEELVDSRLVDVVGTDRAGQLRYRVHELVRLFAAERAAGSETEESRRAAVARTAEAAVAYAETAHRLVCGGEFTTVRGHPTRYPGGLPAGGPATGDLPAGAAPGPGTAPADPLRWYEAERLTLTALVRQAAGHGLGGQAWDLAAVCRCLFRTRGHHDDWASTHRHALRAVRAAGDRRGKAATLLGLGELHLARRRHAEAVPLLEEAHRGFEEVGDAYGAALALRGAARAERYRGRYERALERWARCLPALRAAGDEEARAQVLRWTGLTLLELRDVDGAEPYLRRAEEITRRLHGRAADRSRLAPAALLRGRGRMEAAEAQYRRGLEAARALGDVVAVGHAYFGLGGIALERADWAGAEYLLGRCVEQARTVRDPLLEAGGLFCLAAARGHTGDPGAAYVLLKRSAALSLELDAPVRYARCRYAHAAVLAARGGDRATAAALRAEADAAVAGTGSARAAAAFPGDGVAHYPLVP